MIISLKSVKLVRHFLALSLLLSHTYRYIMVVQTKLIIQMEKILVLMEVNVKTFPPTLNGYVCVLVWLARTFFYFCCFRSKNSNVEVWREKGAPHFSVWPIKQFYIVLCPRIKCVRVCVCSESEEVKSRSAIYMNMKKFVIIIRMHVYVCVLALVLCASRWFSFLLR